jgi:hypothetical protein
VDELTENNGHMQPNPESVDYDLDLEWDDGEVGTDGLTDKQRATMTARYRATIGNPRISESAVKAWKERRHDVPE